MVFRSDMFTVSSLIVQLTDTHVNYMFSKLMLDTLLYIAYIHIIYNPFVY